MGVKNNNFFGNRKTTITGQKFPLKQVSQDFFQAWTMNKLFSWPWEYRNRSSPKCHLYFKMSWFSWIFSYFPLFFVVPRSSGDYFRAWLKAKAPTERAQSVLAPSPRLQQVPACRLSFPKGGGGLGHTSVQPGHHTQSPFCNQK